MNLKKINKLKKNNNNKVETKNSDTLKGQHFDACFNLWEAAIFEIRFLLCDRMTNWQTNWVL